MTYVGDPSSIHSGNFDSVYRHEDVKQLEHCIIKKSICSGTLKYHIKLNPIKCKYSKKSEQLKGKKSYYVANVDSKCV